VTVTTAGAQQLLAAGRPIPLTAARRLSRLQPDTRVDARRHGSHDHRARTVTIPKTGGQVRRSNSPVCDADLGDADRRCRAQLATAGPPGRSGPTPGGTSPQLVRSVHVRSGRPPSGAQPPLQAGSGWDQRDESPTRLPGASAVNFFPRPSAKLLGHRSRLRSRDLPGRLGVADVTVTTPNGTSSINSGRPASRTRLDHHPPPARLPSATGALRTGSSGGRSRAVLHPPRPGHDCALRIRGSTRRSCISPSNTSPPPRKRRGSDFSSHTVLSVDCLGSCQRAAPLPYSCDHSAGTTVARMLRSRPQDPPPAPPSWADRSTPTRQRARCSSDHRQFHPDHRGAQIPNGALINALHGTAAITATGGNNSRTWRGAAKIKSSAKGQSRLLGERSAAPSSGHPGSLGLRTLSLVRGASFAERRRTQLLDHNQGTVARSSKTDLQLVMAADNHGKVPHKGRYVRPQPFAARCGRSPDRCDGR